MNSPELVKWRKDRGYTQEGLGALLGVTKTTVYRWEKAMREIPPFLHLALEALDKRGGGRKTNVKRQGKSE
jgi:DNA-binding XRE family transcriptional regulator